MNNSGWLIQMYGAARKGTLETFKRILEDNPSLDVNWRHPSSQPHGDQTFLHIASHQDNPAIVRLLLAHPRIDVNPKDDHGWTPFFTACNENSLASLKLLLEDPRTKINELSHDGFSPLVVLSAGHNVFVSQWIIASGRDLDFGQEGDMETDPEVAARVFNSPRVEALWLKFKKNPELTRYEVRLGFEIPEALAAGVFLLVVLLCDGLLRAKETTGADQVNMKRFFAIAQRLPMELQMVLCLRLHGSTRTNIPGKDFSSALIMSRIK